MSNKILSTFLLVSSLLVVSIYFMYRGVSWPVGREGIEAILAFLVFLTSFILFSVFLHFQKQSSFVQITSVRRGLWIGLLWTIEICMNNIVRPGLPVRDTYDDIFWGGIAILLFSFSVITTYKTSKFVDGVKTGFWAGFASGAVAGVTALIFIVFGMNFILLDQLNISEWLARGSTSGTPQMSVYFAYQTLAGVVLHLVVLGIMMGLVLGALGGVIGKIINVIFKTKSNMF